MEDVPALAHIIENQEALLAELNTRQNVLRDHVRGVARDYKPGFYLFGRPGTGKTRAVRDVLERQLKEPYQYRRGHLTPIGLFELIEEHPQSVIVLDDVANIFKSEVALQILLAALDQPNNSDRTRVVQYQRQGTKKQIAFSGGIICISNIDLHDGELLGAFKSRVPVLNYDPTDAQIGAFLLAAAEHGWPLSAEKPRIPPEETRQIARYVISETTRVGTRLDLRVYFAKALADYAQWADDETESHWRDLVTASIAEQLVEAQHKGEQVTRKEQKASEVALVREIVQTYPNSRDEQIAAWQVRTNGKSLRAFYRRLAETT
jgi:hypothetical protein